MMWNSEDFSFTRRTGYNSVYFLFLPISFPEDWQRPGSWSRHSGPFLGIVCFTASPAEKSSLWKTQEMPNCIYHVHCILWFDQYGQSPTWGEVLSFFCALLIKILKNKIKTECDHLAFKKSQVTRESTANGKIQLHFPWPAPTPVQFDVMQSVIWEHREWLLEGSN